MDTIVTIATLIAKILAISASAMILHRMLSRIVHRLVDWILEYVHRPDFIRPHERREEPPQ